MISPTRPRWTPSGCAHTCWSVAPDARRGGAAHLDHDEGAFGDGHDCCFMRIPGEDEEREEEKPEEYGTYAGDRFISRSPQRALQPRGANRRKQRQIQAKVAAWAAFTQITLTSTMPFYGPLGFSLAPQIRRSKTLYRWIKPVADWYAHIAGYRQMGLRYDDLSEYTLASVLEAGCLIVCLQLSRSVRT